MSQLLSMRWAVVLLSVYTLLPLVGRIALGITKGELPSSDADLWFFLGAAWPNVAVFTVLLIGARKKQSTPADWGFVVGRGFWVSLILVLAMSLIITLRMPIKWAMPSSIVLLLTFGVWVEELLFRVLLINVLLSAIRNVRGSLHLSVLFSALIFTAVHIPMKTGAELSGIFIGAIFMGYAYVLSGSLLLPLFIHTVSNTLVQTGLVSGIITVVLYLILTGLHQFSANSNNATVQESGAHMEESAVD